MKSNCECSEKSSCPKHYGQALDKWLDQKYPEIQLVREAEKIRIQTLYGKR